MTTVPMRRVTDIDVDGKPGAFEIEAPNEFNKGSIDFICPNGRVCGVRIRNGEFKDLGCKYWGFDGNLEKPTLDPSIDCRAPSGCGWHGHVKSGQMIQSG